VLSLLAGPSAACTKSAVEVADAQQRAAAGEAARAEGPAPMIAPAGRTLTYDDVATMPRPGAAIPTKIHFSPDGKAVTMLVGAADSLVRELVALDGSTGARLRVIPPPGGGAVEGELSLDEQLRRERTRELGLGVTDYQWAAGGDTLLVPTKGELWVQQGVGGELRQIYADPAAPAIDPQLSPDGTMVAFVRNDDLVVLPTAGGPLRALTEGARAAGVVRGVAEYAAQEEMARRHGFWWAPDGGSIALTEVDERHIPVYRIVHQGKDAVGDAAQEDHRYPFAGADNAKVRLGIVPVAGGPVNWLDLADTAGDPSTGEGYLARVDWRPDGALLVQVEDRAQQRLDLLQFGPGTAPRRVLRSERSEVWINLHELCRPLGRLRGAAADDPSAAVPADLEGTLIWGTEASGFMHLVLLDAQGRELRPLTSGEWMVEKIVAVDAAKRTVYVLGTKAGPTERHLYAVSLDGGEPRAITRAPGMHDAAAADGGTTFVDVHSSLDAPPRVSLRSLADGQEIAAIELPVDPRVSELGLPPPRLVSFEHDGVTFHGAVYDPPGDGPHPAIVAVYGGPHAQRVQNDWSLTVDLRAQYLRQQGFVVFKLDNRGSARRGLAFEGAIRHNLGDLEVKDQVAGVQWLAAQGLADPTRVGIYGWSYGGYMAAMALGRAPDTFKAAVAGAPVTHWDGYDTHYTERYMGTPASNPDGYASSAVMTHVNAMRGRLMLVHGLIDENVHFRHTARLVNALIHAQKDYELLLFPDERHVPRSVADRAYMERRVAEFFAAALQ
jgi:dipeptidyl-peptidase-4